MVAAAGVRPSGSSFSPATPGGRAEGDGEEGACGGRAGAAG